MNDAGKSADLNLLSDDFQVNGFLGDGVVVWVLLNGDRKKKVNEKEINNNVKVNNV